MKNGYRAGVALTSLCLFFSGSGLCKAPLKVAPRPTLRSSSAPTLPPDPSAVLSRRALRRARLLLQLHLMELHKARLERVERAIQEHVPIDRLIEEDEPSPSPCSR